MKRLLFPMFIVSAKGGMQQIVIELISHLSVLNWDCTFLTFSNSELYDEAKKKGISTITISKPNNLFSFISFICKLYYITYSYRKELIITNDIYTHILLSAFPMRKKEIFVSHGGNYKCKGKKFAAKTGFSAKIARITFMRVTRFVAVSDTQKEALHSNAKIATNKIQVIYNGFGGGRIINKSMDKRIRISTIGYIKQLKNQHILLKTIKDLTAEGYDCILNLYGAVAEEEYFNYLKSTIRQLKISDRIFFKGYVQNKDTIYSNTDILVSCSFHEGFGLTLIEAMAYRIPTIAYMKSEGPASIITNNVTGILVQNNTSDDYKDAILKYINNNPFTQNIVSNAYINYRKKFSLEKMVNEYQKLLLQI